MLSELVGGFHKLYPMEDPVNYEPSPARRPSLGRAKAAGVRPVELAHTTCCSSATATSCCTCR